MAQTAIDFCSQAMLKCNAGTIQSFDEGTAEAIVASNNYDRIRDAFLVSYPWNFTDVTTRLARLAAAPEADFAHAFQLPPNFLRALSAGTTAARSRGIDDYRISENRLHCDSETVYLRYHFRPDEHLFPPHFVSPFVALLAAEFCVPINGSLSLSAALDDNAERLARKAQTIDAQQDTPNRFEDFSLVECRA